MNVLAMRSDLTDGALMDGSLIDGVGEYTLEDHESRTEDGRYGRSSCRGWSVLSDWPGCGPCSGTVSDSRYASWSGWAAWCSCHGSCSSIAMVFVSVDDVGLSRFFRQGIINEII